MKNVVWMKVTNDELELPIFVAETSTELAKICGVSPNSVIEAACRTRHGNYSSGRYYKVKIDDKE